MQGWAQCSHQPGLAFQKEGKEPERRWHYRMSGTGDWQIDWRSPANTEQKGWGILRTNRVQWEENFLFLWTPGWSLVTRCSAPKKARRQWTDASKLPHTYAVSSWTQCSRRMWWRQFIKTNWDGGAADEAQKRRAWTTLAGDQVQFPTPTSSRSQRHTALAPGDPMPSSPTHLSPAYMIKTTSLKEKEGTSHWTSFEPHSPYL